jgi:hypothetical protein
MEFDLTSIFVGSVGTLMLISLAIMVAVGFILGKIRPEIKGVLLKIFSRTSLAIIAIFDLIAAFDPTQTVFGLGLAPVAAVVVFLVEWILHPYQENKGKFKIKFSRMLPSAIEGIIAGVIVAIPTSIAGLFVVWFGVLGDKKKK